MEALVENKSGYVKTKLGWLPNDWEILYLNEICSKITDGAHTSPPSVDHTRDYPIYSVKNMDNSSLLRDEPRYISEEDFNLLVKQGCKPLKNDLLIAKDGSVLQYCFVVTEEIHAVLLSSIAIIRPNLEVVYPFYLSQYFKQEVIKKYAARALTSGSGVPRMILKDFRKLKISLPPLPEQQKIAQILGTWDKAINKLEKLIAQKERLKKGLMQQLLTGKLRFPGFTDEWEEVKLKDVCQIKGRVGWKGYKTEDLRDSGPLVLGASHIDNSNKFDLSAPTFLSEEKYLESPEIMIEKEDLLIVQRGSLGKVAHVNSDIGPATINPSMAILKVNGKVLPSFLYYQLCSSAIQKIIASESNSTGVPMISQKQIGSFNVKLPSSGEQDLISKALEKFDGEMLLVQKQLDQVVNQKKGLMQKLLTGEVRVKTD